MLIRELVKVNCTGNQSVYSCEVWWAADFQAVKMIIRAQFIKNGKVDLAWSLFIVPETMPITEIFEGIKSGMYFYAYHFTNWSSMPSDKLLEKKSGTELNVWRFFRDFRIFSRFLRCKISFCDLNLWYIRISSDFEIFSLDV